MNRITLKQSSKEQIKGNIGIMFLCMLIASAISLISLIPIAGQLVYGVLIAPVLIFGFTVNYVGISRGVSADVKRLFDGFKNFGNVWVMNFMISLFTFLWSLLFIIPGIVKAISYSFAPYILADNPQLTGMEAINRSKEMTEGHKMDLFILGLSFFWWHLLGVVTFGLAYIYVLPYVQTTFANAYNEIKDNISEGAAFNTTDPV